jgi:hypothetical protein
MSNIDQFESVFRAASREIFKYEKIEFKKILLITDLEGEEAETFESVVKNFLSVFGDETKYESWGGSKSKRPRDVLSIIEEKNPDLVVTYRNLHSDFSSQIYSLGTHLDMISQKAPVPVLIVPHPKSEEFTLRPLLNTDQVMAITDHMDGDDQLVNMATAFTERDGFLHLSHVEDERSFENIMRAISQISEIDTDPARELIAKRLLKEPHQFIENCAKTLLTAGLQITVKNDVRFGRHLSEYQKMIDEHKVDLLVLHAKDEDQLAMHGLAYPLAVELRQLPLLLL